MWLPVDGAGGLEMSLSDPCLIRSRGPPGELTVRLGVAPGRRLPGIPRTRCRPNTVLAAAYDLEVFFGVVDKPPAGVVATDVLGVI